MRVFAGLMLAALVFVQVPVVEQGFPELTPGVARRLDAAVRRVMGTAAVPGAIVGLHVPGKGAYVRAFGLADQVSGARMSPDLYMRIGSVTKTFTVTAVLQLADRGALSLDDPIGEYVGGVPNGSRITLRHLAAMRSGLHDYSADEAFGKILLADPKRAFAPRELLAYSFKHPVRFRPGERHQYSNTDMILLGLAVEKAGGLPLAAYLERNILKPAGLTRTFLPPGAALPKPYAHGYTDQTVTGAITDATGWNPSWGWAAGGMVSTLQDLRTWARVLATGALLLPKTHAERVRTDPGGYGLGLIDAHGWIGHNGSLPGYEAVAVYLPEERATLVVLLNTDVVHRDTEPSTLVARAITDVVTPGRPYRLPG
ncbi:serine hydrolase domain-containing protein [Nonomuraea longicatena]|uniref:Serine hydrolase domain-containing protein n=1 Tax=Nonomuraea longicatena TaxID=83682 RepID=A0ABP3ZPT7_9ACTN